MDYSKILKEIISQIETNKANSKELNYGLLSGISGQSILLAEYSKVDLSYKAKIECHINEIFNSIESSPPIETYCAGISGACIGINYIYELIYKDKSFDFIDEEIDNYIYSKFFECLENRNIDFLHGAIGMGFFYLKRLNNEIIARQAIHLLLDFLNSSAVKEGNKIKWVQKSKDCNFNISLSHGMSSIVMFLSKLLQLNFTEFNPKVKPLLTGAINYILEQEIDYNKYGSFFPYTSKECSIEKSRLGWCYGDLGIALCLLDGSKSLNRKDLEEKAFEIFNFSSERKSLEENLVFDASICHGTSGIAIIFYKIYLETRNERYLQTARYWLEKTAKLYEEGKIFYLIQDKSYNSTEMSLLEGTTGIGLAILYIHFKIHSTWTEFLLI